MSVSSKNQSLLMLILFASSRSCPVTKFSVKPSLLVAEKEKRVANLSLKGILLADLNFVRP